VLAPWDLGHIIKYVARRPTVVDNFGDDVGRQSFAWSQQYYRSTEAEALPELDARQVRYVVIQRQEGKMLREEPAPKALFHSLYTHDGSRFGSDDPDLGEVPALTRHRLVYESRGFQGDGSSDPPILKVYEVVPGSLVVGRAAPGTHVRVTLDLRTNQERRISYEAGARADARGRYELRLPYATREGPWSIKTDPAYTLRCDTQTQFLVLSEVDIQRGSVVTGPAMCLDER
jgi:dolichyl-diphosphooligosaccharide--protein glycosyltransferase